MERRGGECKSEVLSGPMENRSRGHVSEKGGDSGDIIVFELSNPMTV